MKKIEYKKSNVQFIGWFVVIYVTMCALILDKILLPILFVLWVICGWATTRWCVDTFVIGGESVKLTSTIAVFFGVLGLISLLGLL